MSTYINPHHGHYHNVELPPEPPKDVHKLNRAAEDFFRRRGIVNHNSFTRRADRKTPPRPPSVGGA